MYQMTLFFKKVIYKNNNCFISTHAPKDIKLHPFFNFSWGSMPTDPPSKGHGFTIMWLYVQRIALTHANLHFRKKILTPYQILYTLLIHVQMN